MHHAPASPTPPHHHRNAARTASRRVLSRPGARTAGFVGLVASTAGFTTVSAPRELPCMPNHAMPCLRAMT